MKNKEEAEEEEVTNVETKHTQRIEERIRRKWKEHE